MPTISVIVPVYKVEPYIRRCVDSILAQTFRDFELILVDDGSPDSCGAICDEYAEQDSRIHVIHQKNGGLSAARNAGIDWAFANSNSQWLTFIDSDDWVHPVFLERLFTAAEENQVSVSVCGYEETSGELTQQCELTAKADVWRPEDFFAAHMLNATLAWGKLYRKTCFRDIRYPVGRIHEDEYITHRLLFPETEIAVIPAAMYYYFCNPDGITKSRWKPNRIDAIEAIIEQVQYFRSKAFDRAYKIAAEKLAYEIYSQKTALESTVLTEADKEKYSRVINRLTRKALHRYKDVYHVNDVPWLYYYAYPRLFAFYQRVNRKQKT